MLEYKYDLLEKKYAKKEEKKDLRLVAIRITNKSGQDLVFGKDVALTYENGNEIYIMENEKVFRALKQSPASYLWYLLLSPVSVYTTDSNGYEENVFPIGLILGPGLTAGNMIASGSANKKFKNELLEYNLNGTLIKNGETKHGLIGIKSNSYDALRLKIKRYSFFD